MIKEHVCVDYIGGTPQVYNTDFIISGNDTSGYELDWTGKGLDGFISEGDMLRLSYSSSN